MRQLANGWNTKALEVLVSVLEPLKIYERNEGDTMYTVFSPFTKIADVATPDQEVPRIFNKQVDEFLSNPSPELEKQISDKLILWKENDARFKLLLKNSPVLLEAVSLSENLSSLAEAGLEAIQYIHDNKKAESDWLKEKLAIVTKAKQQGGRCELQVVERFEN